MPGTDTSLSLIVDVSLTGNFLDPEVDLPMYSLAVEQAMNLEKLENGDLPHVKLSLEWDAPAKSQIIGMPKTR